MRRVTGLALLVSLGCLAGTVACAPGGPAGSPPQVPRHGAAAQLADAVSVRIGQDRTAKVALSGTIDGPNPDGLDIVGVIRIAPEGISARFTHTVTKPDGKRETAEYIALPDAAYTRPGGAGPARSWTRLDLAATDEAGARTAGMIRTITDSVDPSRNLLRYPESTTITAVDQAQVNGVPAVQYTLVVDLAKAAATQPDPQRRAELERQHRAGNTGIPFALWIDVLNRPLRTQARLQLPGTGTFGVTGTYTDWGSPVEIAAPPPAEVR